MKKLATSFVLLLCSTILFTTTAFATTFTVSDTDISIDIDDTVWYVFTRDNLENNPELGELGLTYDYLYDFMQQERVYLNACLFYSDTDAYIELYVRKTPNDVIMQLSDYPNSLVKEFAKALAEQVNTEDYEIYKSKYKFAKIEHIEQVEVPEDQLGGQSNGNIQQLSFTLESAAAMRTLYVVTYCTVVNGDSYTLSFQSEYPFIEEEYEMMDTLVDSVAFNVDPNLVDENIDDTFGAGIVKHTIKGAVIGGASAAVVTLISRKNDKGKGKRQIVGKRLQKPSDKDQQK